MSATDGIEMKSLEEELRTAFELFDEDKDGEITLAELAKIMEVHGFQPSQEELQRMIGNADTNRNGTVDFQEFLVMMKEMMRDVDEEETVRQAFNVFDKDGDGLISAEEIKQTMMGLGEEVSETEVTAMVKEADLNGDGFIDFVEFSNLMKSNFGLNKQNSGNLGPPAC